MGELVIVAVIGAVPLTITAWASFTAARHSKANLTISKGNGAGNLAEMGERILEQFGMHEARDIEAFALLRGRLDEIGGKMSIVKENIASIERKLP